MNLLQSIFQAFQPLAYIWLPLLAVPVVYLLRRLSLLAALSAALMVLLSGWLLWSQPPTLAILFEQPLGLSGLGRALLIGLSAWLAVAFLFASRISQGRSLFPFLLVSYALIGAALTFQDLVVRVLLLQIAWLVTIIVVQGGFSVSTRAASRLQVLTVLAVPAFLAAGELLERHTLEPGLLWAENYIVILLALGFSLMLGMIPFHAWLSQAAEDGPPLIASYLVAGLGSAYLVLLTDLLGQYAWLANSPQAQALLMRGGMLLLVAGGLLTMTETHLGRMWAYSTLSNLGALLVGLGLGTLDGVQAALLIGGARLLSLLLAGSALATLRHHVTSLELKDLAGAGQRLPLSALALALGGLGMLGIPLTPGFPGQWSMLQALLTVRPAWVWLVIIANGLGMIGYIRAMAAAFREPTYTRYLGIQPEARMATSLLMVLAAAGLLLGLFPQWTTPVIEYLLASLNLIRL